MLMFDRKQENSVKQLSFNKNTNLETRKKKKNWNRNQYQASCRFTKGCQLLKVNEVPCRT